MKKIALTLLSLVLCLFILCSCTAPVTDDTQNDPANEATPVSDEETEKTEESEKAEEQTVEESTDTKEADTDENTSDPSSSAVYNADSALDVALSLVGKPVSELYAIIGEPADRSYASSCMGSGQDGELYYEGFIVCTYLDGENETIVDAYK